MRLLLAAELLVVAAAAAGCSTPTRECAASTCQGCCRDNVCEPGTTTDSCGVSGNACDLCVGAQLCTAGFCRFGTGGAGGGAAGGGAGGGGGGGGGAGGGSGGSGGGSSGGSGGGSVDAGIPCLVSSTTTCMNNTFCYVTTGLSQPNGQCLAGVCDVVTQNCIEPAAECQYGPDGGRDCYPNGTAGEGEECSPTIFCRKGTLCLLDQALNDGGLGTGCARFCRTDADCVSSRQCSTQLQVPGSVEKALLCRPIPLTCNPLTQNCSLGTDSCYLVASTTGCGPTGTAAEGAACATVNACARGYACANGGTGAACHKVCNTDAGLPQCNSGTCYPSPAVGGVGVCF